MKGDELLWIVSLATWNFVTVQRNLLMLIVNNHCADTWKGPEGVRFKKSLQLLKITNLYANESLYLRDEMI